jgi:hypothetical protein
MCLSLPLLRKEDSVVFAYVSLLRDVAMTTSFAFALLYVQPNFNCTTLSCKSLVDIAFVVQLPCTLLGVSINQVLLVGGEIG